MKRIYQIETESPDSTDIETMKESVSTALTKAGISHRIKFKSNLSFEEQDRYEEWEDHMAAG
jgi:hypothetical protein